MDVLPKYWFVGQKSKGDPRNTSFFNDAQSPQLFPRKQVSLCIVNFFKWYRIYISSAKSRNPNLAEYDRQHHFASFFFIRRSETKAGIININSKDKYKDKRKQTQVSAFSRKWSWKNRQGLLIACPLKKVNAWKLFVVHRSSPKCYQAK